MSNLFSSFDLAVTLILTRIISALASASCDLDTPVTTIEAGLNSNSALSSNPTVTRVVTRSLQTGVNSSSDLLTSSLATTLTTRGEAETITSSSLITSPTTLPSHNTPTNTYYLGAMSKYGQVNFEKAVPLF